MAKKIRQSVDQIEKAKLIEELQNRLQQFVDQKERWYMSEFREAWNKKNSEKISELIKLNDRMICRIGSSSVTVLVKTMIL